MSRIASTLPIPAIDSQALEREKPRRESLRAWRRFCRNRVALVALVFLASLHLAVILGPSLSPYDANATDLVNRQAAPSARHWLGTDELGRDELARVLKGGQVSLSVGLLSMAIAITIGTAVGAVAGFAGGLIDTALMRCTDAMMALPTFFIVLAILAVLGGGPRSVVLVIGLTSWMLEARIVRGEFLQLQAREFVEAARALGASRLRIGLRHMLPHAIPALTVNATLSVGFAIITEAAISYLGIGINPPTPSWGNMLINAQTYIYSAFQLALIPGLAVMVTVLAYNSVGDGLRDALDPQRANTA